MYIVEAIRDRNHLVIPGLPTLCLVSANQQDRHSSWIEREKNADTSRGWPEFLHVWMSRATDRIGQRSAKPRTSKLKDINRGVDLILGVAFQGTPPRLKLVRILNFQRHAANYNDPIVSRNRIVLISSSLMLRRPRAAGRGHP